MKTLDDLFAEYMKSGPMVEPRARPAWPRCCCNRRARTVCSTAIRSPWPTKTIRVPAAMVSREQAGRLARLAADGEVKVRLHLKNRTGGAFESRNVVAEIRGRERPEKIVLLGAHLDSWDLGTGAEDNGANSAMVIEAARAIKPRHGPRRTIRFVLFTGEEQGMFGSADTCSGTRRRWTITTPRSSSTWARAARQGSFSTAARTCAGRSNRRWPGVAGLDAARIRVDGIDGTDNFDFLLSGVPNLVANQDARPTCRRITRRRIRWTG